MSDRLSAIAERAAALGLTMLTANWPQHAELLGMFLVQLEPPRAPTGVETADVLATIARLGPVATIVPRALALFESRPQERALLAKGLLKQGLFSPSLATQLREAARDDIQRRPAMVSALEDLRLRFGGSLHYSDDKDLEWLIEQGSISAVVEKAALEEDFMAFLRQAPGQALLLRLAQLHQAARLYELAMYPAQLAFELLPTTEALTVVVEIALDAGHPEWIDDASFAALGDDAEGLRTYARLRAAFLGDKSRLQDAVTPQRRATIAMITGGLAHRLTTHEQVTLARYATQEDEHWRFASEALVIAEARNAQPASAEEESIEPFLALKRHVDRFGNDLSTWHLAWTGSKATMWKAMSLSLLGRELAASLDSITLWKIALSGLCNDEGYRAGVAQLDALITKQCTS